MSTSILKTVEVVAAVIESAAGILCVQRGVSKLKYISEKWEFPGGKIEDGEDHSEALIREISEELQVSIAVGSKIITVKHSYPDFHLTMHAYHCQLLNSEQSVVLTEHQNNLWLKQGDKKFRNLDWAAADLPIVDRIRGVN
jgi:8-oxo-dGTP diphosphatase